MAKKAKPNKRKPRKRVSSPLAPAFRKGRRTKRMGV